MIDCVAEFKIYGDGVSFEFLWYLSIKRFISNTKCISRLCKQHTAQCASLKIPYRFSENRIKFMMHNQFSKKNLIEAIFPYHIFPHYTMLKYILFKTLIICWKNTHKILKRINFLVLCVTEKHKNCFLPFMYCLYIWKKIFFWNNKFLK